MLWAGTTGIIWLASNCSARFIAVDNFEGLVEGAISGQNGWVAGSGNLVQVDPADAANLVLAVTNQSTTVRKSLLLPAGDSRMLFLRFRIADQLSGSFGLSHLNAPSEFSDFGPELNLINSMPDLRVANGDTPGVYDELIPLSVDKWYNLWLLVNTENQTTQVWLNDADDGSATVADKLSNDAAEGVFGFRTATSNDLINFYIKTGSGSSGLFGPLYLDDVYLEDAGGLNLSHPAPPIVGDYNRDGDVNPEDYLVWKDAFGDVGGSNADGNANGVVDAADYVVWRDHFDGPVNSFELGNAVPEPTALSLMLAAAGICLPRRPGSVHRSIGYGLRRPPPTRS